MTDPQDGGQAPHPTGSSPLADEMQQIDSEMQKESGDLQAEIDRRHASESKYIPGAGALDRAWKGHEAKLEAELPAQEAELAARAAGEVATDADEDRHEIEQDVARLGPAAQQAERKELAEAEKLADDAISAGLRVSQDALDARAGLKAKNPVQAKAAEAAAQTDLGRASHDLAEEDALLTQVEGEAGSQPTE